MKKTEIGTRVYGIMDGRPASPITGGPVAVPPAALAGLSLVPWFCDPSIHWAVRLTHPVGPLSKASLPRIAGVFVAPTEDGGLLIGVPGDGIAPSTHALLPLTRAVAAIARPGLRIELATANLGVVKRDSDAKADTSSVFGDQLYRGTIDDLGEWQLADSIPALDADTLRRALACGNLVPDNGPWTVQDREEAYAIIMQWLLSREANINAAAVKHFIRLRGGAFETDDAGMIQRFYGLALAFFRHRVQGGPFRWPEPKPYFSPLSELEDVAQTVVG